MRLIDGDELAELYANTEDTNLDNFSVPIRVIRQNIKDMPTLDYAPVRHGEWLEDVREDRNQVNSLGLAVVRKYGYKCSLCGRKERTRHEYCHCGALMDGGK